MIYRFEAETRLLRWGESSAAGRTITLEIPPDDAPHPFRGFPVGHTHGQRFKMSFVPIGDDETEIPVADVKLRSPGSPPQGRPILAQSPHDPAEGVNARSVIGRERYLNSSATKQAIIRACQLPRNQQFRDWARCAGENEAREFIRTTIGGSRAMIDQVYEFYARFMAMETRYLMETGQMAVPC